MALLLQRALAEVIELGLEPPEMIEVLGGLPLSPLEVGLLLGNVGGVDGRVGRRLGDDGLRGSCLPALARRLLALVLAGAGSSW
jgi:hypothetical protein